MTATTGQRYLLRIRGRQDAFVAEELVEDRSHVLVRGRWRHTEGAHDAAVRYYGDTGWRTFARRNVEEIRSTAGVR